MDYKEKYEQALEYMRTVYHTLTGAAKEDVEHHFPELKESEDEKIRKELIQYLKDYPNLPNGDYSRNDFFSWLEKGKVNTLQKEEWNANDVWNYNQIMDILQEYNRTELMDWLEKQGKVKHTCRKCQTFKDLHQNCPYSPIYQCTDFAEAHKRLDDETHCEFWLENQGEQKPAELNEEDEKIKKEIISFLKEGKPYHCPNSVRRQEWAAWLEKQGKQKPTWSKKDEKMWSTISDLLWDGYKLSDKKVSWNKIRCWLLPKIKSIKDGVQPQPKQEWSEEDEKMLNSAIWHINNSTHNGLSGNGSTVCNWLKSLKERMKGE